MDKQQIQEDMKEAMRAGDDTKKGTLRMLLAALTNKEKDSGVGQELSAEQIQGVIVTEVKKRKEAAEAFEKAGNEDMAVQERAELAILQAYLPEQLTEEEIRTLVQSAIEQSGAQTSQEMGKVMGILSSQIKGKADGALVARFVQERLIK